MAAYVFGLTSLVALAHLCDFLLGQRGQGNVKDRLVDFYILLDSVVWENMPRTLGIVYNSYLQSIFDKPFRRRYFIKVLYYSFIFYVCPARLVERADGGCRQGKLVA